MAGAHSDRLLVGGGESDVLGNEGGSTLVGYVGGGHSGSEVGIVIDIGVDIGIEAGIGIDIGIESGGVSGKCGVAVEEGGRGGARGEMSVRLRHFRRLEGLRVRKFSDVVVEWSSECRVMCTRMVMSGLTGLDGQDCRSRWFLAFG